MGLDCSYDAWHGSYGRFNMWRMAIAEAAGLPPLQLMANFYNTNTLYVGTLPEVWQWKLDSIAQALPIRWECLQPSPLHELLYHSDCDGNIAADHCMAIADALAQVLPKLTEVETYTQTQKFIAGLRAAALAGEPLEFG